MVKGVPATLEVGAGISWEGVPGSHENYNALIHASASLLNCGNVRLNRPTACVVPTVSALNVDGDPRRPVPKSPPPGSGFDAYAHATENLGHTELTKDLCDWILKEGLK